MVVKCRNNACIWRVLLISICMIFTILICGLYSSTLTQTLFMKYVKTSESNYQEQRSDMLLPLDIFNEKAEIEQEQTLQLFADFEPENQPSQDKETDPSIETGAIYECGHQMKGINIEHICPLNGTTTLLLMLVISGQANASARLAIRNTWGNYGSNQNKEIAFVIGRGFNSTLNEALEKEIFKYGDLILGNNVESQQNLTLNVISALEWADLHCHYAKYILKADDDTFINMPKLLRRINKLENSIDKFAIFGRLVSEKNQYRQFPDFYSIYVGGPTYLMTGDITHNLYMRSLTTVYLHLADVFITGVVAQSLQIDCFNIYEFVNQRIDLTPCNAQTAISIHSIKPDEQLEMWQKLFEPADDCVNNLKDLL